MRAAGKLIKLGVNYVVEVEHKADGDPTLTFYRLELSEDISPESARELAAALAAPAPERAP